MKTQIIKIEPDDNVSSIIDKLTWGKAPRVLLVCPVNGLDNFRTIDLVRIKRAAKYQGFMIGLVSKNKEIIRIAKDQYVPNFQSINAAQRRRWKSSPMLKSLTPKKSRSEIKEMAVDFRDKRSLGVSRFGTRLSIFSIAVVAVLVLVLFFIPSAKIQLNLVDKNQSVVMEIDSSKDVQSVNFTGKIPLYSLMVQVGGDKIIQVVSRSRIPEKKATGYVVFTNLTDAEIYIPKGTIISNLETGGILYSTSDNQVITSGRGKTLKVSISALLPGESGNQETDTLKYISGELMGKLTVSNPEMILGGTDNYVKVPSETDRTNLYNELERELRLKATQQIQAMIAKDDIIHLDQIKIDRIVDETFIPPSGQVGDNLSLSLNLAYQIQYSKNADLMELAQSVLKSEIPEGYQPVAGTIKIKLFDNQEIGSSDKIHFRIEISQKIQKEVNEEILTRRIQGKTILEAISLMDEFLGGLSNPTIEIKPAWWQRLPFVALRIGIIN